MSINLRGKGFECPVLLVPGLLEADSAGDTDAPRAELRRGCELPLELLVLAGDEERAAGLKVTPGWILITPAATPPLTGINIAGGGGVDISTSFRAVSKLSRKER